MQRIAVAVALVLSIRVVLGAGSGAIPGAVEQPDALALLREALGGEATLNAVRTLRVRSTINRKPYKDHVEVALALPDRFLRTLRYVNVPDLNRSSAWDYDVYMSRTQPILNTNGSEEPGVVMSGFNGLARLPAWAYRLEGAPASQTQRLDGLHAMFAEFVLPLLGNTSPVYPVAATSGAGTITFRATNERSWHLSLDPITHLPSRLTWTGPVPPQAPKGTKPSEWHVDFSEFKVVGGLRWPHRLIKHRNGKLDEDSTIERYEINLKLADKTFRK